MVIETPQAPTEQIIDSDIHADIMSQLEAPLPGEAAAQAPEVVLNPGPVESTIESMLDQETTTVEEPTAAPDKPVDPEPVVEPVAEEAEITALSPEDMMDATPVKEAELPEDLLAEEEIEETLEGKQRVAFIKERKYNKELKQEVAQLKTELQKYSGMEQDQESLVEARETIEVHEAKIEELTNQIGQLDLSRSPDFKAQYDDKVRANQVKMGELLQAEHFSAEDATRAVRAILSARDLHQREEVIEDTAPSIRGALSALAMGIDDVSSAREAALVDWQASAAAMEETVARERLAEMSGQITKVVESAVEQVVELGNPYYKTTADAEWNKTVEHRNKALKGVLAKGDYKELALYVAEGLVASDLRERHLTLLRERNTLRKELAQVIKAGPTYRGPTGAGGAPPKPQTPEIKFGNGSMEEDVIATLENMG